MHKKLRTGLILAATLATASAGFGASVIDVNSVCQTATCAPGTLSAGQSDSGSFNFDAAINGDNFSFVGNYLNTLNAAGTKPQENLNLLVTLLSTKAGGNSQLDDINITDLIDKFVWPSSGSQTFFELATFSFGGHLASSSQAEEQLIVGTTKLPFVGPFAPFSTQSGMGSASIDTTGENPLQLDLSEVMEFGAGSQPGAFIQLGVAPIPEPGYAIPVVLAVFGLALLKRRRTSSQKPSAIGSAC